MIADYAPLLYVPADRLDLEAIVSGEKFSHVQSVALCLEDAVRASERRRLASGLRDLVAGLDSGRQIHGDGGRVHVFLRPADEEILSILLDLPGIEQINGFILPKATPERIDRWAKLTDRRFSLLPILEAHEALNPWGRHELAEACLAHRQLIPRVRIGANDLFSLLGGLRRPRGKTVYETPVGRVIDELIETFAPRGFKLCGPVFDRLDDFDTLARECADDVQRGLFAKTALTPRQVNIIAESYYPTLEETEEAMQILHPDAPAVFRLGGSMQEPACHRAWAEGIMRRARAFNPASRLSSAQQAACTISGMLALFGAAPI
jgi:citrate lyase beta subunit